LVAHPFSRRLQELLLVALQPPEKVVGYRHAFFAAVKARDFVVNNVGNDYTLDQKYTTN
jgi:hypothetical protein